MSDKSWPLDAEGKPMIFVRARIAEKIPTAKYANVDIDLTLEGFSSSFAPSGEAQEALDIAYDQADEVLQKKRDPIIEELENGGNK